MDTNEARAPGVYQGVPDGAYHKWQWAVSQSTLKVVRHLTPAHARDELMNPSDQTAAMSMGDALHLAALQPEEFVKRVVCGLGIDRRSNANKAKHAEFEMENAGKLILKHDDFVKLEGMAEAMQRHELASSMLAMKGHKELSIVWKDPETGLLCKARFDVFGRWRKMNVIADVKTIAFDMSDDDIERAMGKFGYDVQAAYYLWGASVLAEAAREFRFIFVSKKPPHHIRVIGPTPTALAEGEHKYRTALNTWAKCVKSDVYPGFPEKVTLLGLKPWDEVMEREFDEGVTA